MKLLIIDASGHFHRAFHAYPLDPAAQLRSIIERAVEAYQPDKIISALDHGRETFRQRLYPGYKANRPPSPEGYSESVPAMTNVLAEFGELVGVPDYEADDVIGSLCSPLYSLESITVHRDSQSVKYAKIGILSRDKDLNQLVCENVEQHDDVTGVTYDERAVINKWGVKPCQIPEVLGLSGDATDNIPGVVGIGPKIARELIQYFGTIESLYAELGGVGMLYTRPDKLIKKLEAGKSNAFMSKDLATVRRNIL